MGYQNSTAGTALSEAYLDEEAKQSLMQYASAAARTADAALTAVLREGMVTYLVDLNVVQVYTGSAWTTIGPVHGALTSFTPTITQSAGVALTVSYARYQRTGRLITGSFRLDMTGSGTASNPIVMGALPATAAISGIVVGSAEIFDASGGGGSTFKYPCTIQLASTTTLDFRSTVAGAVSDNRIGVLTAGASNFALASGDYIMGTFAYEAAGD